MLGGLSGWTVAVWFAIWSWTCILLDLVLYLCTSGMLHDFPSYVCVSGERSSVSYGMTWGFSELVSLVHALGLWLLGFLLSPSDMLQVPEALLWRVVAFSYVVVLMFPPLEVAQEVVLVLGSRTFLRWPIVV